MWNGDTDETNRMREEVRRYNEVIANAFIDIPVLDDPKIGDVTTDQAAHRPLVLRVRVTYLSRHSLLRF